MRIHERTPGDVDELTRRAAAERDARLDAGPTPADGVCALRGKDVVRILAAEFGVAYTLGGAYDLLHRLGYSCLMPRPRHEKADPAEQDRFRREAPFLSRPWPTPWPRTGARCGRS